MRKIFLVAIVLLVGVKAWTQQPFELGATKHDSIYFNESGSWIDKVSKDTTLASPDSNTVVTEYILEKYVANTAGSAAGVDALQDSIDSHTDTLQSHIVKINSVTATANTASSTNSTQADTLTSHNTRILANKSAIAAKQDSIDAHTDSLQSHNTRINALDAWVTDSIAKHTDTLQSHNARILDLETNGVTAVSTICLQYICTTDTTSTTPNSSGYFIGIYDNLNGYNLVKVELLYANSQGDMALSVNVWRNRGGTEVAMTSTGASFVADATIDTANDDVAANDRLEMRWTYTGGTTAADGFMVMLTFQEP
jgi:hypothetical protein